MILNFYKTIIINQSNQRNLIQNIQLKMSADKSTNFKKFDDLSKKEQELVGTIAGKNRTLKMVTHDLEVAERFIISMATDEETLWKYYEQLTPRWWEGESELVGVFTTIGDYENKKGNISKAHFTENGRYYKSVNNKTGKEPMSYHGYFKVTKDKFMIDMDITKDEGQLHFKPRPVESKLVQAVKAANLSGIIAKRRSRENSPATSPDTSLDPSSEEEESEEESDDE
jgi:hypothetical protein